MLANLISRLAYLNGIIKLSISGATKDQVKSQTKKKDMAVTTETRPNLLYPWFKSLSSLKGVGPRILLLLEKLTGSRVRDLLFHLPVGMKERLIVDNIADLKVQTLVLFEAIVVSHHPSARSRAPYKVLLKDDSAQVTLIFFNGRPDYLKRQLPEGERVVVSGMVDEFNGDYQITHPDVIQRKTQTTHIQRLEAVYPLIAGLTSRQMIKFVGNALTGLDPLPEWHDPAVIKREKYPGFLDALACRHIPDEQNLTFWRTGTMDKMAAAKRLALDELLAAQLALGLVRLKALKKAGRSIVGDGSRIKNLQSALPYTLTGDQQKAVDDIFSDMARETAMLRLLQGDVGSGKTIIAIMAAVRAAESGFQTALLAPTEILAQQHFMSFMDIAGFADIKVAYLSGRIKGRNREKILDDLRKGEISVLIGTHALIQESVVFNDLGLAIVDEQHRFGVAQRLALASKSDRGLDFLGLSATPIPRSLTLALYGDMEISRILEKPAGRKPILTSVIAEDRLGEIIDALKRKTDHGAQAYWVCPLVSDSEMIDLVSAERRYESLSQIFGDAVGLIHGQMKGEEKESVMARFKAGELSLLVATTVIEVGVDVPKATIMVIEGAERFGLAQLHQLRGRVGRGQDQSSCILIRSHNLSAVAGERLGVMRQSEDGFFIAEEDLRLRGAGEVLGTRQSGVPAYNLVDLSSHSDLVSLARNDMRMILDKDPDLESERGKALRILLYLFEQDAAVRYLRSG